VIRLGLTGSIGMGKSTVAAMLAAAGVPVFDADAVVHRLQGAGGRLVEPIAAAFPGSTGVGGVDRAALGKAVLGDSAALRRLEAIVHPAVAEERAAFLAAHHDAAIVLLDVPLLFETGGERYVDSVAVVDAPPEIQRARVLARAGMTEAKFNAIVARQMPNADKLARADFIIPTGGALADTQAAVTALIACLSDAERR
jgi:dephospho-CoA kinase